MAGASATCWQTDALGVCLHMCSNAETSIRRDNCRESGLSPKASRCRINLPTDKSTATNIRFKLSPLHKLQAMIMNGHLAVDRTTRKESALYECSERNGKVEFAERQAAKGRLRNSTRTSAAGSATAVTLYLLPSCPPQPRHRPCPRALRFLRACNHQHPLPR